MERQNGGGDGDGDVERHRRAPPSKPKTCSSSPRKVRRRLFDRPGLHPGNYHLNNIFVSMLSIHLTIRLDRHFLSQRSFQLHTKVFETPASDKAWILPKMQQTMPASSQLQVQQNARIMIAEQNLATTDLPQPQTPQELRRVKYPAVPRLPPARIPSTRAAGGASYATSHPPGSQSTWAPALFPSFCTTYRTTDSGYSTSRTSSLR